MEEKRSQPNHKILGVNHEVVDEATALPLTSFTLRQKQVSCFVDLTPLVKENELNYVRLRYNEYLLQCGNGPFNLDSNLDQRQEQVKDGEHDISRLKDELEKTEADRRTSEYKLTREAEGHQKRANELEVDVESLRAEIAELKDGRVGAGARQQIAQEVDGALLELGRLENDVELRRKRLRELEDEATKKDEQLIKTRQELENIKSILQTVEKRSEEKIYQLKDSISSKETDLNNYRLEIEALKACKAELQNDLVTTQKEAQELKENVCEKDNIIKFYKTDNDKIAEELEGLRQVLKQSHLVAQKETDYAVENEQKLHSELSSEKLLSLENEVQQQQYIRQQNKSACEAMGFNIQQALDALDVSEDRVKTLVAETHAIKESSARTIDQLQTHNRNVEAALEEMKRKAEKMSMADGSGLKDQNDQVSDNKLFGKLEQERLLSTLDGLDAVDKALSQVENLVHGRSTPADFQISAEEIDEIQEAESLFLRFYPLILTGLFLVLVVGGNIFFDKGGWSLWMPYFVLAALSFALPHPFGAAATLLVAIVVAASSFV